MSRSMDQKCPSCEAMHNNDDQFCGNCGKQLKGSSIVQSKTVLNSKGSAHNQRMTQTYDSDYSTILYTTKSQEYTEADDEWFSLRWFIFSSSALCLISSIIALFIQNNIIISIALLLLLSSLLFGFIQAMHFNQWYWLAFILMFGPLAGLIYSSINPIFEQKKWPSKQLIIILLLFGFALFAIAALPITGNAAGNIYALLSIDLLLAGSILTIVRIFKLGWRLQYELEILLVMIFMCFLPLSSLIYIAFYSSENKTGMDKET